MSVRVEKWKWSKRIAASGEPSMSWDAEVLGEDAFGTWLFCPRGSRHTKGNQRVVILPCDGVQLLPKDNWWAAWWWEDEHWVSVDICTPPRLHGSTWQYVDLDLDLVLLADGSVEVVDQEEFDQAVSTGSIPRDMADEAAAACQAVRRAMSAGEEPFRSAGWRWLESAT
jgi:hypothetical protein